MKTNHNINFPYRTTISYKRVIQSNKNLDAISAVLARHGNITKDL